MLAESFVAISAMIAASVLDQGLYYAINAPAGVVGATAQTAATAVTNLGFPITPNALTAAAAQVQEKTLIAGTRVGRFMLQDTLGNVWKPMARVSWWPGVWSTSAVVVGAWGYFLWTGVTNPLGGINQLFPLFGIANQLLAAVALAVCTTLLIKHDKLKYAWVTAIPLAWDTLVTLTASWQKIFSADPGLGFFAQRDRFP